MKVVHIRIDEKMIKVIEGKVAKNSINFSRYIRSLLEKGLVYENQIEAGHSVKNVSSQDSERLLQIAEILLENLMLTRNLVWSSVTNKEEHKAILEVAMEKSKKYIAKHFLGESTSQA